MLVFAASVLAQSAKVSALISGGFSAAYLALLPQFEKSTGITVTTVRGASQGSGGDGPTTIDAQLRRGLSRRGHPVEGRARRVTSGRQNRYRFRRRSRPSPSRRWRARRNTPSGYQHGECLQTNPAASEIHRHAKHLRDVPEDEVFPQLGIAGALTEKLSGAGAAEVASGKVEMVVLPVSEILAIRSVDLVGTIPADLQFVQVFAAAIVKGAQNPEAAKRLIDFLTSDKATPTVERTGMERPEKTLKH